MDCYLGLTGKGWLANNGIEELPADAQIEFAKDGTFRALNLPFSLGDGDRCLTISHTGTWRLVDSTKDSDLVKWELEICPNDLKIISNFLFHRDSNGIYLENPIDWELSNSVVMRKTSR